MAAVSYRAIALLRILDLDPRPASVRADLQDRLAVMADAALRDAQVPDSHCQSFTGEDHLLLIVDDSPFALATDFLRALHDRLRDESRRFRPEHTMRLVVALDHGLVFDRGRYPADEAVRRCNRMTRNLGDVLRAVPAAVLFVVIADAFHRGVVRQGHSGLDAESYVAVGGADRRWVRIVGHPVPAVAAGEPFPASPVQVVRDDGRVTVRDARDLLRDLGEPGP